MAVIINERTSKPSAELQKVRKMARKIQPAVKVKMPKGRRRKR